MHPLPFDQKEQIREAQKRMTKMSIAGVQPKLSAQLSIKDSTFKIVDRHGSFILKPPLPNYDQVPENEDLTMRMAKLAGIEVPLHGLTYAKDESLLYLIKRFDRKGRSGKIHVEDFAQVAGMSRDTKYNYSIEKIVLLIDKYCSFPMVEKMKLFKRILFSWLTGNEDMHLKNFSLVHRDQKIELSPAYDLLNTSIILFSPTEEMALPLKDKKTNFTGSVFFEYLGMEIMGLNKKVLSNIEEEVRTALPEWEKLIEISFLNDYKKEAYIQIINERIKVLIQ
ncbi:HipA domain-containing protein [Gracilimonas sp. Q87]|uniref:HipA domain-containing protein n=1 Tax=Gracilimonas sp. Q87 TaxID=3384766 RepID=UPI003984313B